MGFGRPHIGGPLAEQLRVVDASIFLLIPADPLREHQLPDMITVGKVSDNILTQPSSSLNKTHGVMEIAEVR